jgi:hypothetical protein
VAWRRSGLFQPWRSQASLAKALAGPKEARVRVYGMADPR